MDRLPLAVLAIVGVPAITCGYIVLAEKLIGLLSDRQQRAIRPWLWIAPALILLVFFLVYPAVHTFVLSLYDARSTAFVGLQNYVYIFTDHSMLLTLRNNVLWLVVFTLVTVTLGLVFAVLADRVRYESVAKAVVFLPMAVSFVAAGVIWKFVYEFRPANAPQTGVLNALLVSLVPGFEPKAWLINAPWNNLMIIAVGVWIWTGFCTVILSAALKGIPSEVLEAARVDGANEWQVFRFVIVPMISATVAVVTTTMVIFALKAFDVVYVMTSGNFDTNVIALRMYQEMFNFRHFGRAAAIAVVLLAAIVPVMLGNIRRFQQQEEMR